MGNEEHCRKLENMYASANCNGHFTRELKISSGATEQELAVRDDLFHAMGAVHGHVYFKMLDDTSFFAVSSLVEDVFVLTVSYTVYFTRPISKGTMRGFGKVVHQSKNLFIAESRIVDSDDKEIARGSGTFMRSKVPLSADIGYK